MILLFEKIQQQNKYGNLPYDDGYLAKVSFYNYIFADLTNISKYLNCNLTDLTDILQNRKKLSQETLPLNNPRIHTSENHSPTFTQTVQDLSEKFDYTSDDNQDKKLSQDSQKDMSISEHAQLPPLPPTPPPQLKDSPSSVLHKANINTANININLSTNHHTNSTNNITTHLTSTRPHNNITDNSSKNRITTTNIINPYAKSTKPNKTQQVTPTKTSTTINTKNTTNSLSNETTTQLSSQSTDSTEQEEINALEELRQMINDHIKTNNEKIFTQNTTSLTEQDSQENCRDITLETFYQHPQAADLTIKVTAEVTKILPKITHNFDSKCKSIKSEEEAANAALAWYNQLKTKKVTEDVTKALDQQLIASPKTIQELIDASINKLLSKTSNQIVKTVEKQIRKNLPALMVLNNILKICSINSHHIGLHIYIYI